MTSRWLGCWEWKTYRQKLTVKAKPIMNGKAVVSSTAKNWTLANKHIVINF